MVDCGASGICTSAIILCICVYDLGRTQGTVSIISPIVTITLKMIMKEYSGIMFEPPDTCFLCVFGTSNIMHMCLYHHRTPSRCRI